jgi:hypothetical protein
LGILKSFLLFVKFLWSDVFSISIGLISRVAVAKHRIWPPSSGWDKIVDAIFFGSVPAAQL